MPRRKPALALPLVLLVAFVLRLPGLTHPLLPDEGYTWLVASAGSPHSFLARLARYENTPPLYYLLISPFSLTSVWMIRLPSLLAGVGLVAVTWAIVRPACGRGAATVAALALAVAPYAVAESDFGRAYMLADLWLALALLAALRLLQSDDASWWWLYGAATILAIFTEYDAATTLLPIAAGLITLRPGRRRATTALALAPALAFLPWLGQFARSRHDFGVTKAGLGYSRVTPASIRDQLVTLFYGRSGQDLGPALRTVALAVLVLIAVVVVLAVRRRPGASQTMWLVGGAGLGTLVLHAVAPAFGAGIFSAGYLTFLLPVGAILLGLGVGSIPLRWAAGAGSAALLAVAVGVFIQRVDIAPDIDVPAIRAVLARADVHTVLTNSAVVDYYFAADGAVLDRPFNLGPGRASDCGGCRQRIAVVDDDRVGSGARPGPGAVRTLGAYVIRVLPSYAKSVR